MMNKKQISAMATGLSIIFITFAVWAYQGFHLFTHEKVIIKLPQSEIEKMLGQPPRLIWVNHFLLGLEYSLVITLIVTIISTALFFLFKTRKDTQ
ncbi:MAG: hypothetical protein ACYDA4_08415 [Ignavibacteriaceae bacterium]